MICTLDQGYYSGIIALSLDHPMETNLSVNKFAAMSYNGDDYDEQYEEYRGRYEEEEILYVDGGLPKHEYDEDYWTSDGEEIRSDFPMGKKNLTEIIEACENMSHCYEDYLALGKNICANLSFGDYIYFKYGF